MKTHLDPILSFNNVTVRYGNNVAVSDVTFNINQRTIVSLIGPSGCGKSTLLRSINRMNDVIPIFSLDGRLLFRGENVYEPYVDAVELRRDIGMVFQKPNPFPMSIYRNIVWAPKIHGYTGDLDQLVETSLKRAFLWEETKDKLHTSGLALSGGQQQRLCIARTIAMDPDVILMDEPCSALDPISTAKIEELITELKQKFTIIIVTHNMQQAARVSDRTAFMYQGKLVEFGPTTEIFQSPRETLTADYVKGRFG